MSDWFQRRSFKLTAGKNMALIKASYELGNKTSSSIKSQKILDYLKEYQHLNKESDLRN
jgi:hypothetical protein